MQRDDHREASEWPSLLGSADRLCRRVCVDRQDILPRPRQAQLGAKQASKVTQVKLKRCSDCGTPSSFRHLHMLKRGYVGR
jgi:hypothetical protein